MREKKESKKKFVVIDFLSLECDLVFLLSSLFLLLDYFTHTQTNSEIDRKEQKSTHT